MRIVPLALLLAALAPAAPVLSASARAEQPDARLLATAPADMLPTLPRQLDLATAERLALARNGGLRGALSAVDGARGALLTASAAPSPTLTFSATPLAVDDRAAEGRDRAHSAPPWWTASLGLAYVWERGGKLELRTRQAESQVSAAEAQVLDTIRLLLGQVRTQFFTALAARDNLAVSRQIAGSLDETEHLLAVRAAKGEIPEGDLIRFKAGRLQFDLDRYAAETAYAGAIRDLAALLGFGPDAVAGDGFSLTGSLDLPADVPADGTLRDALATRPDLLALERQSQAGSLGMDLARAQESRDITITPGLTRNRQSPFGAAENRFNTALGISLSIPIFTDKAVQGGIRSARAQRDQADAALAQGRLQAAAELDKARVGLDLARSLVQRFSRDALTQAEAAERVTEAAYRKGAASLVDLLDARRTLNQTRLSANQARLTLALALVTLSQAAGVEGLVRP